MTPSTLDQFLNSLNRTPRDITYYDSLPCQVYTRARILAVEAELDLQKAESQRLRDTVHGKDSKIEEFLKEFQMLRKEVAGLRATLTEIYKVASEARAKIEALGIEVQEKNIMIEGLSKHNHQLEHDVQQLEEEAEELREDVQEKVDTIHFLSVELDEKDIRLEELEELGEDFEKLDFAEKSAVQWTNCVQGAGDCLEIALGI